MKSLLKNVQVLNFEDLLKVNGGYSGSSGGGSPKGSSRSYSQGGSGSPMNTSIAASSSSYSGSSGGGSTPASSSHNPSSSCYSSTSGSINPNTTRITYPADGIGYSSSSGFFNIPEPVPTRSNQRDFSGLSYALSSCGILSSFGETACTATSLLNEISELYTMEYGVQLSDKEMQYAMEAAIKAGGVNRYDATVLSWEIAANAMANSMGIPGRFQYEYNSTGSDITVYGIDKNNNGICDHFVNSIGDGKYYDPWNGTTGDISEFYANGWSVQTRVLTHKN